MTNEDSPGSGPQDPGDGRPVLHVATLVRQHASAIERWPPELDVILVFHRTAMMNALTFLFSDDPSPVLPSLTIRPSSPAVHLGTFGFPHFGTFLYISLPKKPGLRNVHPGYIWEYIWQYI